LEYSNGGRAQKTRMMPYENIKKFDDMSIRFETVPALDRQNW